MGFEIERPASSWPPPIDGVRWHDLGFVDGRDDSRRVIDELVSSSDEPQGMVIVCALTTTPDRGIGGFIAEVRQAVSRPVGLVLTAGHTLRRRGDTAQVSHRVEDWGRLAPAAGFSREHVIEPDPDHPPAATPAWAITFCNLTPRLGSGPGARGKRLWERLRPLGSRLSPLTLSFCRVTPIRSCWAVSNSRRRQPDLPPSLR